MFLRFAYIINVAQVKKSLFEQGLIIEEEPMNADRKSVFDQMKIYREGYSTAGITSENTSSKNNKLLVKP